MSSKAKPPYHGLRLYAKKEAVRPSNETAVRLLQNDPQQFVLAWQKTIRIIVLKYQTSGLFSPAEVDDVCQFVNQRLLESIIDRMQQQFDGSVRMVTYFSRIVQNLCLEYRRKNRKMNRIEIQEEHLTVDPDHSKLLIADEISRLKMILRLFDRRRPKLILLLKLYVRKPLTPESTDQFCPDGKIALKKRILEQFSGDYQSLGDKEIYAAVLPFFIDCEKKNRSADALRKWTDEKVNDIVALLNGQPPQRNYDRETFRILFAKLDEGSSGAANQIFLQ